MTVYYASIHYVEANKIQKGYWIGDCQSIPIKTNNLELMGNLVEFLGETKESVINQIINCLKSRGLHGNLKINKIT